MAKLNGEFFGHPVIRGQVFPRAFSRNTREKSFKSGRVTRLYANCGCWQSTGTLYTYPCSREHATLLRRTAAQLERENADTIRSHDEAAEAARSPRTWSPAKRKRTFLARRLIRFMQG